MAETRTERVAQWSEHADQLCDEGERVERRVDLESATVVVTNRRVMTFVPDADGPGFRHAERPNVGTVSVETVDRLRRLCWGIAAAFVGVGLLEAARAVSFVDYVPASGLQDTGPLPDSDPLERLVDGALSAIETALLVLDWAVLLSGGVALAVAAALVWRYVRSRSRRLVLRVRGGTDLIVPVSRADLEAGLTAEIETAIRPKAASASASASASPSAPVSASTLEGSTDTDGGRGEGLRDDPRGDERARADRPNAEWLGDEESG
ncbi:hypothetical protein [Natrinema sp. DC36]|uniref:hypothetical protein n=1 Tax=Natrinema sp. DC36 TaxID=2878680 RepID=UPI001CF07AD3|nr:hypothetical protein [Natrinema sp. DC36]